VLYEFPANRDFQFSIAVDNADNTTNGYFDRASCRGADFGDIVKLASSKAISNSSLENPVSMPDGGVSSFIRVAGGDPANLHPQPIGTFGTRASAAASCSGSNSTSGRRSFR